MVAAEAVATVNPRAPDPGANFSFQLDSKGTNRKSDENKPSLFSLFNDQICSWPYQTPLSLPVILNATAAADASGGSRLSRNVAGTFPLNAACVICCV